MSKTAPIVDMTNGVYRRMYAGFIRGRRINRVSIHAEHWFWRINALADDFGNLDANPDTLHNDASPIRRVSRALSARWVKELATANLIACYEVGGEHFIHIEDFTRFQPAGRNGKRIQKCKPYTRPPGESGCIQNNPGGLGNSMSAHSHSHSHSHSDTHTHSDAGELGCGGGNPVASSFWTVVFEALPPPMRTNPMRDSWLEYEQHRRDKRSKLTGLSAKKQAKALAEMNDVARAIAAINHSIANGYTGIFEPGSGKGGRASGAAGDKTRQRRSEQAEREGAEPLAAKRL